MKTNTMACGGLIMRFTALTAGGSEQMTEFY